MLLPREPKRFTCFSTLNEDVLRSCSLYTCCCQHVYILPNAYKRKSWTQKYMVVAAYIFHCWSIKYDLVAPFNIFLCRPTHAERLFVFKWKNGENHSFTHASWWCHHFSQISRWREKIFQDIYYWRHMIILWRRESLRWIINEICLHN